MQAATYNLAVKLSQIFCGFSFLRAQVVKETFQEAHHVLRNFECAQCNLNTGCELRAIYASCKPMKSRERTIIYIRIIPKFKVNSLVAEIRWWHISCPG